VTNDYLLSTVEFVVLNAVYQRIARYMGYIRGDADCPYCVLGYSSAEDGGSTVCPTRR
jgi:hypothetical protein